MTQRHGVVVCKCPECPPQGGGEGFHLVAIPCACNSFDHPKLCIPVEQVQPGCHVFLYKDVCYSVCTAGTFPAPCPGYEVIDFPGGQFADCASCCPCPPGSCFDVNIYPQIAVTFIVNGPDPDDPACQVCPDSSFCFGGVYTLILTKASGNPSCTVCNPGGSGPAYISGLSPEGTDLWLIDETSEDCGNGGTCFRFLQAAFIIHCCGDCFPTCSPTNVIDPPVNFYVRYSIFCTPFADDPSCSENPPCYCEQDGSGDVAYYAGRMTTRDATKNCKLPPGDVNAYVYNCQGGSEHNNGCNIWAQIISIVPI